MIRSYGVEGLREKLRLHLKMARDLAEDIRKEPRLELVIEPNLNTVCFRADSDLATKSLMEAVNATGKAFLTHTSLKGHYVIRVSFGQTQAQYQDKDSLFQLILEKLT